MTDEELIAEMRRVGPVLRRRPGNADRVAGWLLREAADRLEGRGAARCGDHHASGVTNCTLKAGHDGAHHNGSGLTWDRRPAAQDTEDNPMVCSACLTEACAAGTLMCDDARTAGLVYRAAARRSARLTRVTLACPNTMTGRRTPGNS